MRSDGFSLKSGAGLEVGVAFTQHCSSDRVCFHNCSQQALTKHDPDDLYWIRSIFSHSILLLRFATCVEAALAFCLAGAMLRSASILERRFSWQAQHFLRWCILQMLGRRRRDEGGALAKCRGGAVQTRHNMKSRGEGSIFCELLEKWRRLRIHRIFQLRQDGFTSIMPA